MGRAFCLRALPILHDQKDLKQLCLLFCRLKKRSSRFPVSLKFSMVSCCCSTAARRLSLKRFRVFWRPFSRPMCTWQRKTFRTEISSCQNGPYGGGCRFNGCSLRGQKISINNQKTSDGCTGRLLDLLVKYAIGHESLTLLTK